MKFICNNNNENVINGILEKYNITKEELLNPSKDYKMGYKNMGKATDRIIKAINNKERVGILVDDDCDGFTSSAVMYRYLDRLGVPITIFFHEGKQHGLNNRVVQDVNGSNVDLLIVPDAGSSDTHYEELKGIEVVIFDHHLFDAELPEKVIRVNNQDISNENGNPNLTGVGMVYRALQMLDKKLEIDCANEDLDLVALGQIGDSSDYSEQEIRWIVNEGLRNLNNKLIRELLKDRLKRKEKVTGRDCSFEVIPYINAVTRVGSIDEKVELFEGLTQNSKLDKKEKVICKRKDKKTKKFNKVEELRSGYEILANKLATIKKRQAKLVDKFINTGIEEIYTQGGVVIAKAYEGVDTGLTGLIASNLSNKYGRPVVLVSPHGEEIYTGSIRGKEERITSLKDWCEGTSLFNWVQGHDNAAGCEISKDNIDELVSRTEEVEIIKEVEVDYYATNISVATINEIYDNRGLFGGKISYPKIGIENKVFKKTMIQPRGEKTLAIRDGNIEYIIFNVSDEIRKELTWGFNQTVKVNILGVTGINHFMGKAIPQIIVNRIEVVKDKFDFDF